MVRRANRAFAALLAFVLGCLIMAPAAAFAEDRAVEVENHTIAQGWKAAVSDIRIGGVDAPAAGTQLDDTAQVTTFAITCSPYQRLPTREVSMS